MANFKDTFIQFAVVGLFVFGMMSFIAFSQIDNGVGDSILNNTLINDTFNSLDTDLTAFSPVAQNQTDRFDSDLPKEGLVSLDLPSMISIGRQLKSLIVGVYNILIVLPASVLGVPSIVIGVLNTILLMTLVLLIYKLIKSGN